MTPLEENDKAPDFSLEATGGETVSLKDFAGKHPVVLYFYPKDATPGCTKEGCQFRDYHDDFAKLGVKVFGISPDPVASHKKFAAKQEFNFPLLSDPDHAVCEAYGVWKEKNMYGRKFWGVERSTFLIGKDGKLAQVWRKVKVAGHVEAVFEAAQALKA